jgi:hypothetical protein
LGEKWGGPPARLEGIEKSFSVAKELPAASRGRSMKNADKAPFGYVLFSRSFLLRL